jgi:glycosyltransferase involved in cell wall biosynthesis
MRVAFLAQENLAVPPPVPGSSVSRVIHELARQLAVQDVDVAVCSLPHPEVPEGEHEGVDYLRVEAGLDRRAHNAYLQALRVLRRLDLPHRELQGVPFYSRNYARAGLARLAELDPDVVHLQNVSQFIPLAKELVPRAKVVLHMHCDWLRQLPPPLVHRRLEQADLVLGVSDYISGRVREGFPDLAERVRTLHNGVDVDAFVPGRLDRAAERRKRGLGDGPVVLYVGTIATEKGVDVLVRAFEAVLRERPDATLVIVGAPNRYFQVSAPRTRKERSSLRKRQRGYGGEVQQLAAPFGDRIVFTGPRPHGELAEWYALADVFAMPSTGEEPFPLPVLEALASGLPVVATARGGLPESVLDGVDGRIVPAGDPKWLAHALLDVLADPARRAELGGNGRELVAERFTWAHQAERLAGYYRELLGRRDAGNEPVALADRTA